MSESNDKKEEAVCRDYEQGVCDRGSRCKFYHPEVFTKKAPICKDFQNRGCEKFKCKFMHISRDEQREYERSGTLPDRKSGQGPAPSNRFSLNNRYAERAPMNRYDDLSFSEPRRDDFSLSPGNFSMGPALCKDFTRGECMRGNTCKYRHTTEREMQMEQQLAELNSMAHTQSGPTPMYGKRSHGVDDTQMSEENKMLRSKVTELQRQVLDHSLLEEKTDMMRKKITDLQHQLVEVREMNESLQEQNVRFRKQMGMMDIKSTSLMDINPTSLMDINPNASQSATLPMRNGELRKNPDAYY